MIKVSFILDSAPNPTQDIDMAVALEAVGIYPNALDMEESMCVEDAAPAGGEA